MRTLLLFSASLFLSACCGAQNVVIATALTPTIDGHCTPGEWTGAPVCTITTSGGVCTIAIACDATALYLAYQGHLESLQALFPELLLDVVHDRTPAWNADDRWFHVSATCCNSTGVYADFGNCLPAQPNWTGLPLFAPGLPNTDTVEMAIPWATLGSTPQAGDSLGFGLVLTNTFSVFLTWPAGADRLSPATWGELVFPGPIGIARTDRPEVKVFPTLVREGTFTALTDAREHTYTLLDASGRTWQQGRTNGSRTVIHLIAEPEGLYVLLLDGRAAGRLVVER